MSNVVANPWAGSSEQVEWPVPSLDEARQMSRRERLRSRGPYAASVPPEIASLDVGVAREVATEAAEAANALTRSMRPWRPLWVEMRSVRWPRC